jgi:hypothetical protein
MLGVSVDFFGGTVGLMVEKYFFDGIGQNYPDEVMEAKIYLLTL